ncbi:ABC transporter ATP-binding protein [Exiguobacterium undae]|uniref:Bacitracin ABC transporter ATP-binding protein n=1 Tax=Exiguobacterium undae TaxID=169177 RepID=A0ABX2V8F6_9BACL|nr:ABC transporter ATP-binding protein [Exiguobacterium undae]OAN14490.1 bacitracin ABC transporter ATP-binding protein [Exiguobacterium undae]
MKSILHAEQITKVYQTKNARHEALRPTTLTIHQSEFVSIMGPSGAGKSTLLNLLSTIDQPTDGTIHINGEDVTGMREKQLARFRREQLGFIFQDFNLLDTMTIEENIALPLALQQLPKADILARVEQVAGELGIQELLKKRPAELSGGQKQRTAAARAIIHQPSLILADEPTGALDSKSATGLLEAMARLNEQGATILMVTHDPMTASYAERVVFVKDGELFREIHQFGTRKEFFEQIMEVQRELGGVARELV